MFRSARVNKQICVLNLKLYIILCIYALPPILQEAFTDCKINDHNFFIHNFVWTNTHFLVLFKIILIIFKGQSIIRKCGLALKKNTAITSEARLLN